MKTLNYKEWLQLNELTNLEPLIMDKLKKVHAGTLLNFQHNQAFIYDQIKNTLYLGKAGDHMYGSYHGNIFNDEPDLDRDIYDGENEAKTGVVGRIGKGWDYKDTYKDVQFQLPPELTIVAFYTKNNYTDKAASEAVQKLYEKKLLKPDDLVVARGEAVPVQNFIGITTHKEITPEEKRLGNLQVAYHLGAWPNGKRLTIQEKQAIAKELGIASYPMKKNPWQQGMEDQGIVKPGQRWWAPTSEGSSD